MTLDWNTFLTALVTSAGVTGFANFIFRKWIEGKFAKDLETHKANLKRDSNSQVEIQKANLKAQSDVAIEQLKARLQIDAAERNIRFSKIFEMAAITIAATYSHLFKLKTTLDKYTQDVGPKNEALEKELNASMDEFRGYFYPSIIYFEKETAEKIEAFYAKIVAAKTQFDVAKAEAATRSAPGDGTLFAQCFKAREELPALLDFLQAEFRKEFGLSTKNEGNNLTV